MLDIDKIRQLVDMMITNDLVEISLRDGDVEINLRRPTASPGECAPAGTLQVPAVSPMVGAAADTASTTPAKDDADIELLEIKSPMVGTFYVAPDPDSSPFCPVGTRVQPNTVVCIVEAMKVFNEIKAEVTGTIERILVENEQSVEYGQPMFLVRPD